MTTKLMGKFKCSITVKRSLWITFTSEIQHHCMKISILRHPWTFPNLPSIFILHRQISDEDMNGIPNVKINEHSLRVDLKTLACLSIITSWSSDLIEHRKNMKWGKFVRRKFLRNVACVIFKPGESATQHMARMKFIENDDKKWDTTMHWTVSKRSRKTRSQFRGQINMLGERKTNERQYFIYWLHRACTFIKRLSM